MILCASASLLSACVPPSEPAEPEPEVEEQPEGVIPWAPGEAPTDASSTTREVTPLEEKQEPEIAYYESDGVQTTGGGVVACAGKATPQLQAAVRDRSAETKSCQAEIPAGKAGAKGDLKWSVRVESNGEVRQMTLLEDNLKITEMTSCAEKIFRRGFAETPPFGGCATFVVPLHVETEAVAAKEEATIDEGAAEETPSE
jgi:hypothetical protein